MVVAGVVAGGMVEVVAELLAGGMAGVMATGVVAEWLQWRRGRVVAGVMAGGCVAIQSTPRGHVN